MKAHHTHVPGAGNRLPVSTYRLQLGPDLTFAEAESHLDYLADLGVTDLYCSPILTAAPGSTHGYDVVDHTTISEVMGGQKAFESLASAAHERGMGVIVDVVPNHMAVPTPLYLNRALWSVLKEGPESPFADWFDVEIDPEGEGLLMPILGSRIGNVLAAGELALKTMVVPGFEDEGEQTVLTYYDHVFPVREGTESLPMSDLVERQFYRLAFWRVSDEELNYRRFFDVDTLAAVRVEDPEVFAATHRLLLDLYKRGHIDGFRIDHPDGLADPRGYFRDLAEATGGAYVTAEKILDGEEELPSDWPISGTTGYDAAWRIQSLHTDPTGMVVLGAMLQDIAGDSPTAFDDLVEEAKEEVIRTSLFAEIDRLARILAELCQADVRLRDHTFRALRDCVIALIVEMDRYRAYVVPGEKAPQLAETALREAGERAKAKLEEDRHETLEIVINLLLGEEIGSAGRTHEAKRAELIVRFQQTCGPVMAKGVEDTAFYRWTLLVSSCEVGSNPHESTITPDQMHAWVSRMIQSWPATMTLGTTHDTKRGEDVRARIGVLSDYSKLWLDTVTRARTISARYRPSDLDGRTENLMWQTIAGTWTEDGPIETDRLIGYLTKASREQKTWTTWTNPNEDAETALFNFVKYLLTEPKIRHLMENLYDQTSLAVRSFLLASKTTQLTLLGVADNYQGEEVVQNSLVDPDNRRPVDFTALATELEAQRDGLGSSPTLAQEKLWVVSKILRLRKEIPDVFVGEDSAYQPLPVTTGHAFAYLRSSSTDAVAVVTERLHKGIADAGGYGQHSVVLPEGTWTDILTSREFNGGDVLLKELLDDLPVAVLRKV